MKAEAKIAELNNIISPNDLPQDTMGLADWAIRINVKYGIRI